jgi:hypothetical protein
MAIAESVHIHSILTMFNQMVCVYNMPIKKKQCRNNRCTNNDVRNGVCINHDAKCYCSIPQCGKPLFQARKCRFHFRCLLSASTIDSSEVQNEMIIMGHQILSCHVPVVRTFFILKKMLLSSLNLPHDHLPKYTNIIFHYPNK